MKALPWIFLALVCGHISAQNRPLDLNTIRNWPKILNSVLSDDGNYVIIAFDSNKILKSRLIDLKNANKILDLPGSQIANFFFCNHSKTLIYQIGGDTLCLFDLGTSRISFINGIKSFETYDDCKWLVYFKLSAPVACVMNLETMQAKEYINCLSFLFNIQRSSAIFVATDSINGIQNVVRLNPESLITDTIYSTLNICTNLTFNGNGTKIVWLEEDQNNIKNNCIKFYSSISRKVESLVEDVNLNHSDLYITKGQIADKSTPFFSDDDSSVFFSYKFLNYKPDQGEQSDSNLAIWSYADDPLRSKQIVESTYFHSRTYIAEIAFFKRNVVILENGPNVRSLSLAAGGKSKYALITSCRGDLPSEYNWRKSARPILTLISFNDGTGTVLNQHERRDASILSPLGKFVVWYDFSRKSYFSYNVNTRRTVNITSTVDQPIFDFGDDRPELPGPYGIAGWSPDGKYLYIYDQFDIWKCDLEGRFPSLNITKHEGRKLKIVLRVIKFGHEFDESWIFRENDSIYLAGFDIENKNNGFFLLSPAPNKHTEQLFLGPHVFYIPSSSPSAYAGAAGDIPIKARNKGVYILTRMASEQFPNLFVTRDFKTFRQLTFFHPQDTVRWYQTELIRYPIEKRQIGEAIVYKPNDFDPNKKYPVIIYIYEKSTGGLNKFITPDLCDGPINIPYFVSHGYVVVFPNIYYKIGFPGESAYKAVTATAEYINKFKWVGLMGVQGHSFGGYEVNYIVTKTNIFSCALSAAGMSDLISDYDALHLASGMSNQFLFENEQTRIGHSLWETPDLYIENSPILNAKNVKTPVLLVHNSQDIVVPPSQSLEYYLGLRRLNKQVWMLDYKNEGHVMDYENNKLDYSNKLLEFFDYYLLNKPKPEWLTLSPEPTVN